MRAERSCPDRPAQHGGQGGIAALNRVDGRPDGLRDARARTLARRAGPAVPSPETNGPSQLVGDPFGFVPQARRAMEVVVALGLVRLRSERAEPRVQLRPGAVVQQGAEVVLGVHRCAGFESDQLEHVERAPRAAQQPAEIHQALERLEQRVPAPVGDGPNVTLRFENRAGLAGPGERVRLDGQRRAVLRPRGMAAFRPREEAFHPQATREQDGFATVSRSRRATARITIGVQHDGVVDQDTGHVRQGARCTRRRERTVEMPGGLAMPSG